MPFSDIAYRSVTAVAEEATNVHPARFLLSDLKKLVDALYEDSKECYIEIEVGANKTPMLHAEIRIEKEGRKGYA